MPALMPEGFINKPHRTVNDLAVGEEGIVINQLSVCVNLKGETYVVASTPLLKERLSDNYIIVRKDPDGYCLRVPKGARFEQDKHVFHSAVPVVRIEILD